jgi:hypothetical protein
MRRLGAALGLALLLTTVGCGGSTGTRPTTAEISKALKDRSGELSGLSSGLDDRAIGCAAKAIEASSVSDRTLQALVEGRKPAIVSRADTTALLGLATKVRECATQ